MKKLTIIFLILVSTQLTFGQIDSLKFEVIDYYTDGSVYRTTMKWIENKNEILDLKFYRVNFFVPYYLPDKFINTEYRNDTITVWRDENTDKDFKNNWTNTYIYDYQSRIISYSYSGCFVCSNFPYNFKVIYDEKNRVISLKNDMNDKKEFKMIYDITGSLIELKCFSFNNLTQTIKKK